MNSADPWDAFGFWRRYGGVDFPAVVAGVVDEFEWVGDEEEG